MPTEFYVNLSGSDGGAGTVSNPYGPHDFSTSTNASIGGNITYKLKGTYNYFESDYLLISNKNGIISFEPWDDAMPCISDTGTTGVVESIVNCKSAAEIRFNRIRFQLDGGTVTSAPSPTFPLQKLTFENCIFCGKPSHSFQTRLIHVKTLTGYVISEMNIINCEFISTDTSALGNAIGITKSTSGNGGITTLNINNCYFTGYTLGSCIGVNLPMLSGGTIEHCGIYNNAGPFTNLGSVTIDNASILNFPEKANQIATMPTDISLSTIPTDILPITNSELIGVGNPSLARTHVDLMNYTRLNPPTIGALEYFPTLKTFNAPPVRDGIPITSTINKDDLVDRIQADIADSYFDDISKIKAVYITYQHADTRETKTIVHTGPDLAGVTSWSTYAQSGVWKIDKIKIVDYEGAEHILRRSLVGGYEDLTLS